VTAATLDPFVLEHAPGPVASLHPSILEARAAINGALTDLAGVSDEALGASWDWDGNQADVRYGYYRLLEAVERGKAAAGRALEADPSTEARDAVAAATAARWDLHGILASLDEADLDADPGGGEWTVRRTLAHINSSQRGYAWGSAWWLWARDQPRADGPQRVPLDIFDAAPEEESEAAGSLAEIRAHHDGLIDSTSTRYACLTPDELAVMGGWSGVAVDLAFRQWRWSSHIQEHTVQVEKTLDLLGRRPTEVARLVRLIARAYGRLEAVVFFRSTDALEQATGGESAADVLHSVAAELAQRTPTIVAAAERNIPAPDW
jgi:hypothetical protein